MIRNMVFQASARPIMEQIIPWVPFSACEVCRYYAKMQSLNFGVLKDVYEPWQQVKDELPKQLKAAKDMHKTKPLEIDADVKDKDLSGYKAGQ